MPRSSLRLAIAVAMASFTLVACRHRDESPTHLEHASFTPRDTTRVLGPGDIRIQTTDSSVELALIGDSVVTGLGTRAMAKVREKTDTTADSGSSVGASIAKIVKSTVASTISRELKFPIADFSDVRYENGALQFYGTDGKPARLFQNTKVDGRPMNEAFSPSDAQRFVDAFHARKAAHP